MVSDGQGVAELRATTSWVEEWQIGIYFDGFNPWVQLGTRRAVGLSLDGTRDLGVAPKPHPSKEGMRGNPPRTPARLGDHM